MILFEEFNIVISVNIDLDDNFLLKLLSNYKEELNIMDN